MKRKAVLIESSRVKDHKALPGALVDVANWISFLQSDLGGAWRESEIATLSHPSLSQVENELSNDKGDYCFVAYSGHGREGNVFLNDYWVDQNGLAISNLKPKTARGTLIIDSCRGVEAAKFIKFSAVNEGRKVASESYYGRSVQFASANEIEAHEILEHAGIKPTAKQRWETSLSGSPEGIVEMLACSEGQGAEEDPIAGGYYTSLLLQSADLWLRGGPNSNIHTTREAHYYAASKLPPQQIPEYKPLWLHFPFAVKT
jgi:Caspase domain